LGETRTTYAFGQGEWKRYEGGTYAPVDAETVSNAIEAVLVDAKPERIRPTTGLRNSVAELARTKVYVPHDEWDVGRGPRKLIACGTPANNHPTPSGILVAFRLPW
jgi:hypothetical protein